ncbi:O-acetyl-ADP-ribose deacetylase [Paenarthrobacter sp. PH39-S1]|uniref:O-acetyl-ADP-ribose deacetylase n=1 Tax=Paenarthrobacter sp. PH39-S1 TaxID=3046204 RepID=UPI0024BB95D5|nr:O-acetyl-ADP-ribose deacetylase [Paenarthrobacter sp. PH39-S1]MDJ0354838.1 O-acetyl-ADP-ribose deacetylase [Paenarthrobacter sp. PH39-S1]
MRISIVEGDITGRAVDAVVNAADSALMGGGGVDGAIHRAAGPELLAACRELRRTMLPDGLPVGAAVATKGFRLPAQWVIHTVGPNLHAGQDDPALLTSCFTESLRLAARLRARSLAFPAVSAGIYGWPAGQVAALAFDAVRQHQRQEPEDSIELVEFVLFSRATADVFRTVYAGGNALS